MPTVVTQDALSNLTFTTPVINGVRFADVGKVNTDSGYTATATDKIIRIDCTNGNFTLNLPTAVGIAGTTYTIIRTDILASTNILTIDANSTETIDGNLTYVLFPAETIILESDGANWNAKARSTPNDIGYFFTKNTTNNRWYAAGGNSNLLTSTTGPSLNFLRAFPFPVGRTTKFDSIAICTTTASTTGGLARLGIYRDNGNMYPGTLIFDSGSFASDDTAGMHIVTITSSLQIFQPGLYWLAAEFGVATCQLRILGANQANFINLGFDSTISTGNYGFGYNVAHNIGALPDPYTASATIQTSTPSVSVPYPAIFLRAI